MHCFSQRHCILYMISLPSAAAAATASHRADQAAPTQVQGAGAEAAQRAGRHRHVADAVEDGLHCGRVPRHADLPGVTSSSVMISSCLAGSPQYPCGTHGAVSAAMACWVCTALTGHVRMATSCHTPAAAGLHPQCTRV
jgi:hypothetical protein